MLNKNNLLVFLTFLLLLTFIYPIQLQLQYNEIQSETSQRNTLVQGFRLASTASSVNQPDENWRDISIEIPETNDQTLLGEYPVDIFSISVSFTLNPPYNISDSSGLLGEIHSASINFYVKLFKYSSEGIYKQHKLFNGSIDLNQETSERVQTKTISWKAESTNKSSAFATTNSQKYIVLYEINRITEFSNETVENIFGFNDFPNTELEYQRSSFKLIWPNNTPHTLLYSVISLILVIILLIWKRRN